MSKARSLRAIESAIEAAKGKGAADMAQAVFDALVNANLPKDTRRHETNGTYWARTVNGEKMVNKITVQI